MSSNWKAFEEVFTTLCRFSWLPPVSTADKGKVIFDPFKFYRYTHSFNVQQDFLHQWLSERMPKGAIVAELFAGRGEESKILKKLRPDCTYYCLDIDNVPNKIKGLAHIQVDCTKVGGLGDLSFDVVFSGSGNGGHFAMNTTQKLADNFKFVRSVLKTKGTFVVSYCNQSESASGDYYFFNINAQGGKFYHWHGYYTYDKQVNSLRYSGLCFVSREPVLSLNFESVYCVKDAFPMRGCDRDTIEYLLRDNNFIVQSSYGIAIDSEFIVATI